MLSVSITTHPFPDDTVFHPVSQIASYSEQVLSLFLVVSHLKIVLQQFQFKISILPRSLWELLVEMSSSAARWLIAPYPSFA